MGESEFSPPGFGWVQDSPRRPETSARMVARGPSGRGEALDFAVSSGLQSDLFLPVAETPGFVFQRYEN